LLLFFVRRCSLRIAAPEEPPINGWSERLKVDEPRPGLIGFSNMVLVWIKKKNVVMMVMVSMSMSMVTREEMMMMMIQIHQKR
jgi:hypothetical protein